MFEILKYDWGRKIYLEVHPQGFTPMTEEGRRGRQLEVEKVEKADRRNLEEKERTEKEKTDRRQLLKEKGANQRQAEVQ